MIKILLLIDYSSEFDRKLLRDLSNTPKKTAPGSFTDYLLIIAQCMENKVF